MAESRVESKIELFVRDVSASRAFYALLGFEPAHTQPSGYTTLAKGPAVIALWSWGDRDFRLRDPDGYYVRISEGVAIPAGASPSPAATPSSDPSR